MPIGVGAALLGSAIAGGVANVAGAKMASNSAKNAAKTQSAAADKALALNQQAWQQQQALQAPYQQAGRSAVNNLSALMTPGVPYTPQMQAQNAQMAQQPMPGMMPPPPQGPPQGPPMGFQAQNPMAMAMQRRAY